MPHRIALFMQVYKELYYWIVQSYFYYPVIRKVLVQSNVILNNQKLQELSHKKKQWITAVSRCVDSNRTETTDFYLLIVWWLDKRRNHSVKDP